jgi:hypothetical protein
MFDLEYYNNICDYGNYLKQTFKDYNRREGGRFKEDEVKGKASKNDYKNKINIHNDTMLRYYILVGDEYYDWYASWYKPKFVNK